MILRMIKGGTRLPGIGRPINTTQVATYKTLASRLKWWAKMKPQTLSTKPWRVVACMRLGNSSVRAEPTDSMIFLPKVAMN